jgi:sugar transferase (PEP-CTERM/EpsH1 system associated)
MTQDERKILFLTPRFPLPANTGAKIRTFNLLKQASLRNKVTLLSFSYDYVTDMESARALEELGIETHFVKAAENSNLINVIGKTPYSIKKYYSKRMKEKISELIEKREFDIVHFDHLHMGQYVNCVNGIPAVLDEHNVENVILKRYAETERNLLKKIAINKQRKKMRRFEARAADKFSRCFTVSQNDKDLLNEISPKAKISVIPNGVDTTYFNPQGQRLTPNAKRQTDVENTLVFTGSMDWLPNDDAVVYFCKEILPIIWRDDESVKFCVVGKSPSKRIRDIAEKEKRIIVTGLVDDVREYLDRAKAFVAPLRIGGGTRLKILEAMSMEKPVISTSVGAEGIKYTDGQNIIIADSPDEFADSVLRILRDEKMIKEIGEKARALVCMEYDWHKVGVLQNEAYAECLNG